MKKKYLLITIINHLICVTTLLLIYSSAVENAQAISDPLPFLGPIYYGDVSVLKVFDHELPLWRLQANSDEDGNDITRHYDGSSTNDDSSSYGYDQHTGIDYNLHYQPVLAAYPGEVIYADWSDRDNHRAGYGLYVKLEHKEGQADYETIYGHLSSLTVQFGQDILVDPENREGILGISGNTGAVTGTCPDVENNPLCAAHLHFEIRYLGKPVNPYGWINDIMSDPWAVYSVTTTPYATPGGSPTPTPRTLTGATSYDIWLDYPANPNATAQYPGGTPIAEPPAPVAARTIDDADSEFGYYPIEPVPCMEDSETGGLYDSFHYTEVNAYTYCEAFWQITPNELTEAGWYDVYVHIPEITWTNQISLTRGAEYTIISDLMPPQTAIVVQAAYPNNSHPDRWVYIGRYQFSFASENEYIRVGNQTLEDDGEGFIVAADAIQLAPVNPGQPITPTPTSPPTNTPTITPTPIPGMVTASVLQSSSDAGPYGASLPTNTGRPCTATDLSYALDHNEVYFGHCGDGTNIISGFHFQNVDIPDGATITQAYLEFTEDDYPASNILDVILQGELVGDSVTFSETDRPSDRFPLTSGVNWHIAEEWHMGDTVESPDISSIVQAIVDLPDWTQGDSITIITSPGSSGINHRRVFAWDRAGLSYSAKLLVWYSFATTPTPTPTYTPTPAPTNTGFMSPNASVAGAGGDGNGYETQTSHAYSDNGLFAGDKKSGAGNYVGDPCVSLNTDKHIFRDYQLSIPTNATVLGIEVRLDAYASPVLNSPQICVQLSWNGGVTWTSGKLTPVLTNGEVSYILGNPTDLWGRSWLPTEFSNSNFRVRVIDFANSTSTDFYLDWVAVKVYYQ